MAFQEGEIYLGDAVYASFDGHQFRLRTGDGNNQVIYLEPGVLGALNQYASDIRRKAEALMNGESDD